MTPTSPPPPSRPRIRLHFTLRLLLATLTLLCLALGWWTHRAREQQRLVVRIRESGGRVEYDYQRSEQFIRSLKKWQSVSQVPKWLLDLLGEDYFHEVIEVWISDPSLLSDLPRFDRIHCIRC